jgi:hypothetical protein
VPHPSTTREVPAAGSVPRHVADHAQPDAVLVQLRDLLLERAEKELHQDVHFVGGPAPVLAGEREQRQVLDAALDRRADDRPHGLDALAVPGHARQQPLLGPAAVAVHDDRDVPRNAAGGGNLAGRARMGHGGSGSASRRARSLGAPPAR